MTSSHFPQRQAADPQPPSYAPQLQQPLFAEGDPHAQPLCDPDMMQQQLELFVREGVLDSAQLLGELLIALATAPHADLLGGGGGAHAVKNSSSTGSAASSSQAGQQQLSGGSNNDDASHASSNGGAPNSYADAGDRVRAFHAKSYYLFAELLVAKREFKRAIQYYKRHWKLTVGNASGGVVTSETVDVKSKIAKCWIQLENPHQAIEMLNSIPSQTRTLSVNLTLGKLYLHEGLKNKAEECYTIALRQNPYALEATLALTDLAASKETSTVAFNASGGGTTSGSDQSGAAPRQREIEKFYLKLSAMRSPTKFIARADAAWMQTLVNAHMSAKRGRYRGLLLWSFVTISLCGSASAGWGLTLVFSLLLASMDAFESLEKVFPNSLHCLLHKGKLEMDQEFYHQAHLNFHKARQVDDQNLTMMDLHADCLRKNNARTQLNNLVHDLFETSDCHAEAWLAAAYYSDMKGEHETALQFSERAIMTDRRHAAAHLFRGSLLLTLHRPDHALVSFTTSCKLTKTLEAYAGMISSYCDLCTKGINKYKEAVTTAKSVVKLFPQKAHSYTLLGSVFALRPENKEHARKAFQKALTLEPRKLAAIFGLVDLLVHEGNFSVAIDRLLVLSEQYAREEVFTKLGDVYTLNKQFGEAMTQYHRSLSLNPVSSEALRGLDRLEKLMRGEDPDELNTTMDHMDQDDPEDSMEASEYINS